MGKINPRVCKSCIINEPKHYQGTFDINLYNVDAIMCPPNITREWIFIIDEPPKKMSI